MGNMLVKVHRRDGSVKYYKPPICVMDILVEHPGHVVVSVRKGKTNILSSELDLLPGGKYYVLSPEHLLSTTGDSQIPSDHSCSCGYQTFGQMPHIVAIYFASAASLFGLLIPGRRSKKAKLSGVTQKHEDFRADRRSGHMTRLFINFDKKSPATTLSPSALTPRKKSTLEDLMVPQVPSLSSNKAHCCSPLVKIYQKKVAKVGGGTSHGFSKEKWLEDMIRGADNQWKKIKLEQAFIMEDAESKRPHGVPAKPSTPCLPSSSRSPWTSSAKKDEYLKSVLEDSRSPSPQPPRESQDSSDISVHDEQQLQHENSRGDPQQETSKLQPEDCHGASAKTAVTTFLQLEIEQTEHLEFNETDDKYRPQLKQKMDAMERLSLLGPSSSPPSDGARNYLQKLARSDSSLRSRSLNFSCVDR